MKIYIVTATHPMQDGHRVSAHLSLIDAQTAALAIVDEIVADILGSDAPSAQTYADHAEPAHTPENWATFLMRAQISRIADREKIMPEIVEASVAAEDLAGDADFDVWIVDAKLGEPTDKIDAAATLAGKVQSLIGSDTRLSAETRAMSNHLACRLAAAVEA